jgi:hypothetical protein
VVSRKRMLGGGLPLKTYEKKGEGLDYSLGGQGYTFLKQFRLIPASGLIEDH